MSGQAIAIIPARGGSKRIPRKNIRPFEGRPMVAYSIEAALKSACFEQVMVSTDDQEIAAIAVAHGATVPFMRDAKTSDDYAGVAEVVLEVLSRYKQDGHDFEQICCILPTAPMVSAERLRQGKELLNGASCDAVVPVVRFGYPPQRGFKLDGDNRASMVSPEHYQSRSQDLEPIYHDCGQFYWTYAEALKREKRFFCQRTAALVLSELEVQDIDSEEDWQLAELKYRLLNGGAK